MKFKFVKTGMILVTDTTKLATVLGAATNDLALITTSPLSYDWDMVNGDLTYATGGALTAQALDTLTLLGPFQDPATEEVYYKFLGTLWTNESGGSITITGVALRISAGPTLEGVLVFDDEVALADGDSLTIDVLIGLTNGSPDSSLEILETV